jgi:tetratricopeptide (TPR) repeat protein
MKSFYSLGLVIVMLSVFGCSRKPVPSAVPAPAPSAETKPPPGAGPEKIALDYFNEGTLAFLSHDYANAIPPYEKALDLEKKQRKLEKNLFVALIDNLATAYPVPAEIKKAREVLEFGISKEPSYPMFYYNIAVGYAEVGDEANAVKYLRLAAKNKANMIEGETFPDPAADTAFHGLMKSASFIKALAEIKGGKK